MYSVVKFNEKECKMFECIWDGWFVDENRKSCFWPPSKGKSYLIRALSKEKPDDSWKIYECTVVSEGHVTYNSGFEIVKEKCAEKFNTSSADEQHAALKYQRKHPVLASERAESFEYLFTKDTITKKNSGTVQKMNARLDKPLGNLKCKGKGAQKSVTDKMASSSEPVQALSQRSRSAKETTPPLSKQNFSPRSSRSSHQVIKPNNQLIRSNSSRRSGSNISRRSRSNLRSGSRSKSPNRLRSKPSGNLKCKENKSEKGTKKSVTDKMASSSEPVQALSLRSRSQSIRSNSSRSNISRRSRSNLRSKSRSNSRSRSRSSSRSRSRSNSRSKSRSNSRSKSRSKSRSRSNSRSKSRSNSLSRSRSRSRSRSNLRSRSRSNFRSRSPSGSLSSTRQRSIPSIRDSNSRQSHNSKSRSRSNSGASFQSQTGARRSPSLNALPFGNGVSPASNVHYMKLQLKELLIIARQNHQRIAVNDRRLARMEVSINKILVTVTDLKNAINSGSVGRNAAVIKPKEVPKGFKVPVLPIETMPQLVKLNRNLRDGEFRLFLLSEEKYYCSASRQSDTVVMTTYLKRFISLKLRDELHLKDPKGTDDPTLTNDFPEIYNFLIDVMVQGYKDSNTQLKPSDAHIALRTVWGRTKQMIREKKN